MRLLVWLLRRPMIAVLLGLMVVTVSSMALAAAIPPSRANPELTSPGAGQVAPSTLPRPTQRAPQRRVRIAHMALHDLGRACEVLATRRQAADVEEPLDEIVSFARDFPSAGFNVDGESASTLALLVVVRNQLLSCEPSHASEVERLLPVDYRGG